MPPKRRIFEDDIVAAALEVVRAQGIGSLNARNIAVVLGSSTQPLFSAFDSMADLCDAVATAVSSAFIEHLERQTQPERILISLACAYVDFALQEPEFFRLLFLSQHPAGPSFFTIYARNSAIKESIIESAAVGEQQAWDLFFHVMIFSHGIAALLVNDKKALSGTPVHGLIQDAIIGFYRLYS